ncbi:lipopolysaccharide assembly protein LapA domain-containing protein [Fictibacillus sp. KIGAM418]|uniref:Lipopolysaccharide assembly protein LapA domain-containing protein n=1 Tax=Fictibacillus marinisediminis TaxID=2878389 RepID=A0A9X2BIU6_9BACL|nr:lipopolysaccharide assembly protein LapA domain-containing protein [Fictibacillus marinisediminis]
MSVKWPLVLIILGSATVGELAVGLLGFIKIMQLKNTVKRLERERPVKVATAEVQHSPEDTDADTSRSRLPE